MNKQGFTLAELLIVVAIIAVLVAIVIPIFSSQLEKAREATDVANIRDKYAEMMTEIVMNENTNNEYKVTLKQQKDGWQNTFDFPATEIGTPTKGGTATLEYKDNTAYINYGSGGSSGGSSSEGTTSTVSQKAIPYPTEIQKNQRTVPGTLYKYNDEYFVATKEGEMDDVPQDNTHGLYKVNISTIHTVSSKTNSELSKITNISRGDVIYVKDENSYYVYYDTNGKVKENSDLQLIK